MTSITPFPSAKMGQKLSKSDKTRARELFTEICQDPGTQFIIDFLEDQIHIDLDNSVKEEETEELCEMGAVFTIDPEALLPYRDYLEAYTLTIEKWGDDLEYITTESYSDVCENIVREWTSEDFIKNMNIIQIKIEQ